MKTVTETFNIYTFDELTEDAKSKAICYYEQYITDNNEFTGICLEILRLLFPNSKLKVEYDLGYSQGDFFNFYGTLDLTDLYSHISSKLSSKQIRFYNHILKEWACSCEIPCWNYSVYKSSIQSSILDCPVSVMERYGFSNIPYSDIETINTIARDYLSEVCESLKNDGYNYFYPDSDYIRDYYNNNEYYFTADGKPYL